MYDKYKHEQIWGINVNIQQSIMATGLGLLG